MLAEMDGILLVDKPVGWTSFDVVGKVRRIVSQSPLNTSQKKRFPVGHTGTLDPLATGLLVLLLGSYTKKAPGLTKMDKTYEVVMRLGQTSTTGDEEGGKTIISDRQPTIEELHIACARFEGDIMQVPPIFSAIKIDGQRAYKLARAGKPPEMKPRPAHVERIILQEYTYPDVRFTAHVSSGTYIRTLVGDIGRALDTGAYMAGLRRTRVGPYLLDNAVQMDGMTAEGIADALQLLRDG
jgi:tRNA pseudouridine55 synthase